MKDCPIPLGSALLSDVAVFEVADIVGLPSQFMFALRPAGRAFSSGSAFDSGWPGGATERRIESMIDDR
jgi:hypothetical protein